MFEMNQEGNTFAAAGSAMPSSDRPSSATACGSSSLSSGGPGTSGVSIGGGGGSSSGGGAGFGFGAEEDDSAGAVCELREDVGSVEEVILTHNAFIRKVASEAGIR